MISTIYIISTSYHNNLTSLLKLEIIVNYHVVKYLTYSKDIYEDKLHAVKFNKIATRKVLEMFGIHNTYIIFNRGDSQII